MVKKALFGLALAVLLAGGVSAVDFGKINSTLGPRSSSTDIYGGLITNTVGANFEWGLGGSPVTLGMGFSPLIIGEYALRVGYHPDFGVKGLDLYLNATVGMISLIFIPSFAPQAGIHLGVRYFFGDVFGIFAEGGWAINQNYAKVGISLKKKS
jgi:hypothetical protein